MDGLPAYTKIDTSVNHEWKEEDGSEEHTFSEEIEGATEYAVGMWCRWMTLFGTTPLKKKYDFHSVFRLTSVPKNKDSSTLGDRLLGAWLTKWDYLFSTYDRYTNNANVGMKVPYHDNLEGE